MWVEARITVLGYIIKLTHTQFKMNNCVLDLARSFFVPKHELSSSDLSGLPITMLCAYLQMLSEGKFASASTISSPCPIRAKTPSKRGERIRGIPRNTTILVLFRLLAEVLLSHATMATA